MNRAWMSALVLVMNALPLSLAVAAECDPQAPDYRECLKREENLRSNAHGNASVKLGGGSLQVDDRSGRAGVAGIGFDGLYVGSSGWILQGKLAGDVAWATNTGRGTAVAAMGDAQVGIGQFYRPRPVDDKLKGTYWMVRYDGNGIFGITSDYDEPSVSHSLVSTEHGLGFIDLKKNISLLLGGQVGVGYGTLNDGYGTLDTIDLQAGLVGRAQVGKFSGTGQIRGSVGTGAAHANAAVSARYQHNDRWAIEGDLSSHRVATALTPNMTVRQATMKVSFNPWVTRDAR